MDLETIRNCMESLPRATQEFPFGPEVMVYKVMGKMFGLISLEDTPLRINLKCDPDHALALRSMYDSVLPGYHMNKTHWNTVILDDSVPPDHIFEMVEDSYQLVVKTLKKADREKLAMPK